MADDMGTKHESKRIGHTPGPWEQDGLTIKVTTRGIIAICPVPQKGGTFDCQDNARLIAAAPELLAALKAMLTFGEKVEEKHLMGDEGCFWPVEQARAAIRAAEEE